MNFFKATRVRIQNNWHIILICFICFVLCSVGISYALPFHVIGDEESLIGGALTMLEHRTLIPSLKPDEFSLLYYPVGIPYILIIFLAPVLLVKFIVVGSSVPALTQEVLLNSNFIWVTARLGSALVTTLLAWTVYRLGKEIKSRQVGMYAALFFSTSFYVVQLGHWARHWPYTTLVLYALAYAILTAMRPSASPLRKFVPGIIGGIGVGIYYVVLYGYGVLALCTLLYRKLYSGNFLRFIVVNGLLATLIGIGMIALNYRDFVSLHVVTLNSAKTFDQGLSLIADGILILIKQETVLFVALLYGILFLRGRSRMIAVSVALTFFTYLIFIYLFGHFEPRYIYLLIPALALVAGLSVDDLLKRVKTRWAYVLVGSAFIYAVSIVIYFNVLLLKPSSFDLAKQWVYDHHHEELLLLSSHLQFPRTNDALARASALGRLRAPERYELYYYDGLPSQTRFNYVNAHFWPSSESHEILENYRNTYKPRYAIIELDDFTDHQFVERIIADAKFVKGFNQRSEIINFTGNFFNWSASIFTHERLGPRIEVYEFEYSEDVNT